jgi:PD-(D/E)XK nuclease superfamily
VIPQLPTALGDVSITRYASPSLLSESSSCIVRTFARDSSNSRFLDSLIRGPFVEVGRAVHKALEIADGAQNIEEIFYELIRSREKELQGDDRRRHYSNLKQSVGQDRWNERLEIVKNHLGMNASVEIYETRKAITERKLEPQTFKVPSEWVELYVVSDELSLRGQIDRLEILANGIVRIIDYKTGEVLDDEGKVKREYLMQLAAYEAICRRYWPDAQFELSLDNGVEVIVEINNGIRNEFQKKLNSLRTSISHLAGQQVSATSYESLSSGCLDCPIRHTCNSYRAVLDGDFLNEIVAGDLLRSISDGFGVVEKIHRTPIETVANVRTGTGRKVQLRSSFDWQVSNLVVGNRIAFFGFTAQRNKNKATGTEATPFGYSDSFRNSRNWNAEIFLI